MTSRIVNTYIMDLMVLFGAREKRAGQDKKRGTEKKQSGRGTIKDVKE